MQFCVPAATVVRLGGSARQQGARALARRPADEGTKAALEPEARTLSLDLWQIGGQIV